MAFGFGGSSAKQKSNSTFNEEMFGGPQWEQFYNNMNTQWGNSQPNLGMGTSAAARAQPYMDSAAQFGQQGANYQMGGGTYGNTDALRNDLYAQISSSMRDPSSTGKMYEDIIGGKGNTYIDPLVASMRQSGNQALNTNNAYNAADAAAYGQSGSSRQAMQNAMNTSMANRDMAGQENAMRAGAYDTDLNWKMNIARQADEQRGLAQDRGFRALDSGNQSRQWGTNFQPTNQNLGMGTMAPWMTNTMMPWQMANMYGSSMGPQNTLGRGSSSSKGKSNSFGMGF